MVKLGGVSFQRRLRLEDRPVRFNPVTRRPQCRWCAKDVAPPKRTFCSDACVHEYRLRSDPQYLRKKVLERDKGVCAACGLDCVKLHHDLWKLKHSERRERLKELKVPGHRMTFWDADHIKPVAEGGGLCDLSNMQTLCVWCHWKKKGTASTTDGGTSDGSAEAGDHRAGVRVHADVQRSGPQPGLDHEAACPPLHGSSTSGGA
jgi:5-methylcytosine-specific restriction enzyme A